RLLRFRLQADEHLGGVSEVLQRRVWVTDPLQRIPDRFELHRIRVADFQQHAASEVDTEVEALYRNGANGRENQQQREGKRRYAFAKEVKVRCLLEEFHVAALTPRASAACDCRRSRSQWRAL